MNRATSIYLDLSRFIAAMLVFLTHASYPRYGGQWLGRWGAFGHDAVVIFFVLSGYVIAYVSEHRHSGPVDYAISRLARLWSVALPALLLGIVLDRVGRTFDPRLYDGWWVQHSEPVYRFCANIFFFSELWLSSVRAFGNGPYWSINFEAWYYVFFAVCFYARGGLRWGLALLVAGIMGPKLLLLMPIWWFGYWAYRRNARGPLPTPVAYLLFLGSWGALYLLRDLQVASHGRDLLTGWFGKEFVRRKLYWSNRAIGDTLLGLAVAMNFVGFYGISNGLGRHVVRLEGPIRWLAGYTFTIYLFHYPLLLFYNAITHDGRLAMALTLQSVLLIGLYTEQRKGPYLAGLRWAEARIRGLLGGPPTARPDTVSDTTPGPGGTC